jgi:hypothetical protein
LVPISIIMNRLLTGYGGWFNKKYKRHGQFFQNRYKSILCQEDPYFKELVTGNSGDTIPNSNIKTYRMHR